MKRFVGWMVVLLLVAACSDDKNSKNNNSNANNQTNNTTNNANNANNTNNVNNTNNTNNITNNANNTNNVNNVNNVNNTNNNTNNPAGACDNPADRAIIDNTAVDQDAITGECSRSCFLSADFANCVAQCVAEQTGLSEACSACYGQTADCGKTNCLSACMGGASPDCEACLDEKCHPAFVECAGVEGR